MFHPTQHAALDTGDHAHIRHPARTVTVRSWTVPTPVIRITVRADGLAIAALRRAWTAEDHGDVEDEGFEARFLDWYERESARRITWLAEVAGEPVAMMNLAVFERMPRPGRDAGTWAYLANAFVLAPYRNQGIGGLLLSALLPTPTPTATSASFSARPSARSRSTSAPASPPTAASWSATPRCNANRAE